MEQNIEAVMGMASQLAEVSTTAAKLEVVTHDLINTSAFTRFLFEREDQAHKAACTIRAILEARSLRSSDISQRMPGKPAASHKEIQRFLDTTDP